METAIQPEAEPADTGSTGSVEILTIGEAAGVLRVSTDTVWQLIDLGQLAFLDYGHGRKLKRRQYRVTRSAIAEFVVAKTSQKRRRKQGRPAGARQIEYEHFPER